jgi:hypothetical protein
VSHPVFFDSRTLLYLASSPDGSGPWIHSLDVEQRHPRRVTFGIDRYTSLSSSADGPSSGGDARKSERHALRLPISGGHAEMSAARRIPLTTGNGSSPRLGAGYLLYVSSKGTGDSIWKLQGDAGPAIARGGRRIAFSVSQSGQTLLYVANADGTDARIMTKSFELQGAPAWTPDDQAITVAAIIDGIPRLFSVPLDGGSPSALLQEYSVDPVWSPDGEFVAFSGPDIGTTLEVKAVRPMAAPTTCPNLR